MGVHPPSIRMLWVKFSISPGHSLAKSSVSQKLHVEVAHSGISGHKKFKIDICPTKSMSSQKCTSVIRVILYIRINILI